MLIARLSLKAPVKCLPACLPWLHGFLLRTLLTWSSFLAEVSLLWQLLWVPWLPWDEGEGGVQRAMETLRKVGAAAILKELKVPRVGGKWVSGPSASESGADTGRADIQENKSISLRLRWRLGKGNGTPLQYSCLENLMDRGAWWASIYGVAQSWTQLKRLSSSSHWRLPWWFSG